MRLVFFVAAASVLLTALLLLFFSIAGSQAPSPDTLLFAAGSGLFITAISITGMLFLTRPLKELASFARSCQQDTRKLTLEKGIVGRDDELGMIASTMNDIFRRLRKRSTDLHVAQQQVERLVQEVSDAKEDIIRKVCDLEFSGKHERETKQALVDLMRRFEEQVQQRTVDMQKANEHIVTLLHEKDEFVARVAHDLRSPLTTLKLIMPVLAKRLEQVMSAQDKKDCRVVSDNVQYLSELIDDTLMLTRLDAGKEEFTMQHIPVSDLVQEFLKSENEPVQEAQVQVDCDDVCIMADRAKLLLVLHNIFANAIAFAQSKPVNVRIDAHLQKDKVRISITDQGIGVEKARLDELFDEFSKIDGSRHERSSGLGLAICRRIINRMDGRIWAESEGINKGLSIVCLLPATAGELDERHKGV